MALCSMLAKVKTNSPQQIAARGVEAYLETLLTKGNKMKNGEKSPISRVRPFKEQDILVCLML
jgi:hypothetical protein